MTDRPTLYRFKSEYVGWFRRIALRDGAVVPVEPDYEAAAETAKRIFGPDVEWAQHPDPMTDDDWLRLARLIVDAAIGGDDD
jgi:hypothetical protein